MTQSLPHDSTAADFQSHMGELNALLEKTQQISDPAARETVAGIVQALLEFHGAGIAVIVESLADAGPLGQSILNNLTQDDAVSSLLLLYGLHPEDMETRINTALEKIRPALGKHSSTVELLRITETGAVQLYAECHAHGCGSTKGKVRGLIEQAIYDSAPEVTAVQIEGIEDPQATAGFVSIDSVIAGIGKHSLEGH